jgi:hypothetical protein
VALGTCGGRPRDLDEELWVHGRRLCLNFHIKRRKRQEKKEKISRMAFDSILSDRKYRNDKVEVKKKACCNS